MITQTELKERFNYDPDTGIFTHKRSNPKSKMNGKISGGYHIRIGYHAHSIDKKHYLTHRLAWLYVYGEEPDIIDHINGIKTDNRISNLRNVNVQIISQNIKKARINNKSGYLGVRLRKNGKYAAQIYVNGKNINLGTFECPNKAHQTYLKAKSEFHEGYVA